MKPALNVRPEDVTPGIYTDIPYDVYRHGPGIANSDLDLIRRSPAHYWAARLDPEREPEEESLAKTFGRAHHTNVLEPHLFEGSVVFHPDMNANKKEVQEIKSQARAEGKDCLNEKYLKDLRRMKMALMARQDVNHVFREGRPEVSVYWFDPATGLLCKARIDWLTNSNEVADLKSAEDCRASGFQRAAYNYGYHYAAAHYTKGLEVLAGKRPEHYLWIAQEKKAPFATKVHRADEDQIMAGDLANDEALELFARCLEADSWPVEWGMEYGPEVADLGLPHFAKYK